MKINKIAYFIVAFLAAFSGTLLVNQATIIRQLDDWRLLPQTAHFSELYFTNERQLPSVVKVGSSQKLTFAIHNLEHRTTNYNYNITAVSSTNGAEQFLGEGVLTLDHGQTQTANPAVQVPALGARLAMKVNVKYEGILPGRKQPQPQTQSIFFWAKTEGSMNQGEVRRGA